MLSVVMARLMGLKAAAERNCDEVDDSLLDEDLIEAIEDMGGEERFKSGLGRLERDTGLARGTIIAAKRNLHRLGVIVCTAGGEGDRGETLTDLLAPNWDFRVVVTPAGPGQCYLDFDK